MGAKFTTPFREFIKRDENNRYHVRLSSQTFSTNHTFTDIRLEKETGSEAVSAELLTAKPWILRNLQQEVDFQRRKQLAIDLARTNIPAHERRAYKRRMGWVGAH